MDARELFGKQLAAARDELLDLSARNRLLNTPLAHSRTGSLMVVDELGDEVFRKLVRQREPMSFLPSRDKPSEMESAEAPAAPTLGQPEDEPDAPGGIAARHVDDRLQTGLSSEALQKRLLSLSSEARTILEEQGVNCLFLAIGFLEWYEAPSSDVARFAPLVLVPAQLDRKNAKSRFQVSVCEPELLTNLSLQAMLQRQFGLHLPELPEGEEWLPGAYASQVETVIADQPRWRVHRDRMVLWFFSFGKYLMYRDLLPETWPADEPLQERSLVCGLLAGGIGSSPPLCGDSEKLDSLLAPSELTHVVDADSSQTVAIEEVKRGRNLVIQGPPGTGKSQTIVNLIAAAVQRGHKVLFLAEKLAALEVVKSWLEKIGLGSMCLELHSQKAKKKEVLEELGRALSRAAAPAPKADRTLAELERSRERLNQYAELLHQRLAPSGLSPYEVMGKLSGLRSEQTPPPAFELSQALAWSAEEFAQQAVQIEQFAAIVAQLGNPQLHPWRGVGLRAAVFTDVQRLMAKLTGLSERFDRLIECGNDLGRALALPPPVHAAEVSALTILARQLSEAPPLDPAGLADRVWQDQRSSIARLLAHGERWKRCREALGDVLTPPAWQEDVAPLRRIVAAYGGSWLRFVRRDYSEAVASLRGLMRGELPSSQRSRLALLDALVQAQEDSAALARDAAGPALGQAAFGRFWHGCESDWAALRKIEEWERAAAQTNAPARFRQVLQGAPDVAAANEARGHLESDLQGILAEIAAIFQWLKLDVRSAFGSDDLVQVPFSALKARLAAWLSEPEGLTEWIAYRNHRDQTASGEAQTLADLMDRGEVDPRHAAAQFRLGYYEAVMRSILESYPQLATFDGQRHQQQIVEFQRLDERRLIDVRQEVARAHDYCQQKGVDDAWEMAIIRSELEKKQRHKSVRQLLKEAGGAVQALKPVFMMSPISVAQFLEPGAVEFDLLIIDEASQVRPVDALGAIARARQIVVVGDSRQLPPTQFFCAAADDGPDDEPLFNEAATGDMESILSLCLARNLPQRMLRWHYRSRHQSLIAVSNREFYDGKLFIVPSPLHGAATGLQFRHVPQGVYDRGGSRTNQIEAQQIAEAVIEHARQWPNRTLGVGALSLAQADAIRDQLEVLRRRPEHSSLESFFAPDAHSPFFVKNLENIQGDERDVIFISIGYARDDAGYMTMAFGPVTREGGERRLNVLFTRAREECIVFSSITADDIDLVRTKSRGAAVLKTFLSYAHSGILDIGKPTGRDFDSDFERQVAREVRCLGYEVEPQVGVAGFFIDLAVRDREQPGRYLLGIECDGASYHSSRSARDRDRLRQQVLESRGWTIHRVWSTDWFHRPAEQARKIKAAIDAAQCGSAAGIASVPVVRDPVPTLAPAEAAAQEYRLQAEASDDLEHTLLQVVRINFCASLEAAISEAGRRLQLDVQQSEPRDRVRKKVEELVERGELVVSGGLLSVPSSFGVAQAT
jgi:very-short-patch-repair endonuclease